MKMISSKQAAYLSKLIHAAGKEEYQRVKARIGLHGLTIMQLTTSQASRLIKELQRGQQ